MAQKKKSWYAVRKGRQSGLYKTWAECQKQVIGYPAAEFKGFYTKEEAEEYMNMGNPGKTETASDIPDPDRMTAYVDGSYMACFKDEFSFGAVFLYKGKIEKVSRKIIDAEEASMRNVAGEIHGARFAMEHVLSLGIHEMDLYYDYMGIEKWCTGEWKRNTPGTRALKAYYDSIRDQLKVHFHKVKSHTGVKYNEMVDQLAKEALLKGHQ